MIFPHLQYKDLFLKDFQSWDEWTAAIRQDETYCKAIIDVHEYKSYGVNPTDLPTRHPYWKDLVRQKDLQRKERAISEYHTSGRNHFIDYLFRIGFKPYRTWVEKGVLKKEYSDIPWLDFSSMQKGMCAIYLEKDGNVVVWGLGEKEKPPTLLNPRPQGCYNDDMTNDFISNHTHEEIFAALNFEHA